MAKYISNRLQNLKIGIVSYTEDKTVLEITGNVGIGTTNPTSKLHVVGDVRVTGVVTATTFVGALTGTATTATNLNGGAIGNIPYQSAANTTVFLTNGGSGTVLQSNGPGAIPTWVPAAPAGAVSGITVRDSNSNIVGTSDSITQLTFSTGLSVTGTTGAAGIATITLSSNIVGTSLSISGISTFTNGPVLIGSGTSTGTTSQRLQVTGGAYVSGNLGIGTTNPTFELHVIGDGYFTGILTASRIFSSVYGEFTGGAISGTDIVGTALSISGISTFTNGPILIGTATSTGTASQRLQVTGGAYVSGNLGIGTTNPTQTLHVQGNARITGAIRDSTGNPGTNGQVLQSTGNGTGTEWTTAAGGGLDILEVMLFA
jgi:hypothetical protein